MSGMPRKLPPYVTRERDRHGNLRFYFRRRHGKRTRLPDINSEGFEEAYATAIAGGKVKREIKANVLSLEWLISQYRQSVAYQSLSHATRRQRDNIFRNASMGDAGRQPYTAITKAGIAMARDKRAATPAQARNFLDAMRGLFGWAAECGLVKMDPTLGVKNPPRRTGAGFPAWTKDDAARYEARWPLGTRQRVWYAVLRFTGVRRGDAVTIGWQHVRDGVVTIWTEKSQGRVEVSIPIRRELAEALAAGPTSDLA